MRNLQVNASLAALKPPFTLATAIQKVRLAEDAWNSKDPFRVAQAYSVNSQWRNRDRFLQGRKQIEAFLAAKWERELDYRLAKSLWALGEDRIAVRFQYEYRTVAGRWYRAYGNENWEFDEIGLMRRREASINELEIHKEERKFTWPSGSPRPRQGFEIDRIH